MISHLHCPGLPLSQFVELFWYYEGLSLPHKKERLLPQGTVELVIDLRRDREGSRFFPEAVVSGPHSRFFIIDTTCQAEVIGIHFRPGGAFPFFKMPADELQNQHISLDDLWGPRGFELRERVLAAPTPQSKVQILERFLMAQALKPLCPHPAVSFALREFQQPETPAIARGDKPNRAQFAALYSGLQRGSRLVAQAILPCPAFSAGAADCSQRMRS
jgi:hypothetical protein